MVELDNKNGSKDYENSLKELTTANPNFPWAYIRKGLLSEGYSRLRFWGAYFREGLFFFLGGGGLIIGILRVDGKLEEVWGYPTKFLIDILSLEVIWNTATCGCPRENEGRERISHIWPSISVIFVQSNFSERSYGALFSEWILIGRF